MSTTNELAQAKAEELTLKLGIKVYPIVFRDEDTDEELVGYLKEPARIVKLRVLDKALSGFVSAANELLDIIIIKEESDPRMYSERPEDDKFVIGATMAANDLIKSSINQFKKK